MTPAHLVLGFACFFRVFSFWGVFDSFMQLRWYALANWCGYCRAAGVRHESAGGIIGRRARTGGGAAAGGAPRRLRDSLPRSGYVPAAAVADGQLTYTADP